MDATKTTIRFISAAEWEAHAGDFHDLTVEQVGDFAEAAIQRIGGQILYALAEESGDVIGAACIRLKMLPILRKGIAYISGGPLFRTNSETFDPDKTERILVALRHEIVENRGHILRIRLPACPPIPNDHDVAEIIRISGFSPTERIRGYETYAIDTSQDTETLRRKLNGKWRTDLKYAIKQGVTCEIGQDETFFARFRRIFDTVKEAKGFDSDIAPETYWALPNSADANEIVIATYDGEDIGAHMSHYCGRNGVYLFGATNDAGRRLKAGYLLNWTALERAHERGAHWYDLGGVDEVANPSVFRFKKRMGGTYLRSDTFEAAPTGVTPAFIRIVENLYRRYKGSDTGSQ